MLPNGSVLGQIKEEKMVEARAQEEFRNHSSISFPPFIYIRGYIPKLAQKRLKLAASMGFRQKKDDQCLRFYEQFVRVSDEYLSLLRLRLLLRGERLRGDLLRSRDLQQERLIFSRIFIPIFFPQYFFFTNLLTQNRVFEKVKKKLCGNFFAFV